MIPFLAVLVLLAAILWRVFRPGTAAGVAVAVVLLLPPLYAGLVLWQAAERLDALELRYVGKQVSWGPGLGVTAGGADPGGGEVEDLWGSLLGPRSLRIEPAPEGSPDAKAAGAPAVPAGTPVLHLSGVAPVVRVSGRVVNSHELMDGDLLRLLPAEGSGEAPSEAVLRDGGLVSGEGWRAELPGRLERFLRPGRVAALVDLWGGDDFGRTFSFLEYREGAWHAVLRDERLQVVRDGAVIASLTDSHPLPPEFSLRLQVMWGDRDQRRLRTVRRDHLRFFDDHVEVRFAEPERRRVPLEEVSGPLEMGLVVPSSNDRRPRLVEFQERSPRFHGLTATLGFDPASGEASLDYLGGHWVARPEELYGLGEGHDLMLLRLERTRFPWGVLVELAILPLFFAAFLWPALRRSPALTAVTGAAGLLLADRLLFAWRAAGQPPDFFLRGYAEARLALWLIPSLLLFGWTAGYVLRRLGRAAPVDGGGPRTDSPGAPRWRTHLGHGARRLRWPLFGLGTAAFGCFVTGSGDDLRVMALLPLVLAVSLCLLYLFLPLRPGLAGRWAEGGWRWPLWGLLAAGAAVLLVRWIALALGMREAVRLPIGSFRFLWTVVQLPLSAVLVGLGCHAASEAAARGARPHLVGVASVVAYLVLAFAVVGVLVSDLGLLLVHALPVVFALVLLLPAVGARASLAGRGWKGWAPVVAAFLLAVLPLAAVLSVNLMPSYVVRGIDWVLPDAGGGEAAQVGGTLSDAPHDDVAERMRATPQQQLFRLYMLANPERLRDVGLRPAERVAVQYDTMKSYADSGWRGEGFHSSELPRHLGVTYLNDLMPMTFVLADFGKLGMLALVLTYLALLAAAVAAFRRAGDRWGQQGAWVATLALLAAALPGVYMSLANLNLVLFSGKNSTLLALNSASDVLQGGALLAVAAFGLALAAYSSREER